MHVKFRRNLDRIFWTSIVVASMSAAFTAYIFCNEIEIVKDPDPAATVTSD